MYYINENELRFPIYHGASHRVNACLLTGATLSLSPIICSHLTTLGYHAMLRYIVCVHDLPNHCTM